MRITSEKRILTQPTIDQLNFKYKGLSIEKRVEELYQDFCPDEIMPTSSFAATSEFLLHHPGRR